MKNKLEEYYIVTTFSSPALGPLNQRQSKIRDHFVRTMEFLGLADVDIDSLTKEQRDEILALAAQRRKELDSSSPKNVYATASGKIKNKERDASVNKREWDIRHNLNIKLYKALNALGLVIDDVEILTQEQRGIIYAELKRREAKKESTGQLQSKSYPSEEYEKLEKTYKPAPFVDVSSLLELVATPTKAKLQVKSTKKLGYNNQEPIGVLAEPAPLPGGPKPKAKDSRNSTALCPKPYKRTYATKEIALDFISKEFPKDKKIAPYICSCGAIHIGH